MKKIMVAGDWHMNTNHAYWCFQIAKNNDIDIILQLGDFGYWEHSPWGKEFLDALEDLSKKFGIEVFWIDGNHENHELLRSRYLKNVHIVRIRKGVYHIPRGETWEWDGVKFLAMGGAYSIDKDSRFHGVDWWPEETIKYGDIMRGMDAGKVDILVSHDVPAGGPLDEMLKSVGYKHDADSKAQRELLRELCFVAQPDLILHGHYHHRYSGEIVLSADFSDRGMTDGGADFIHTIQVEGLDRDGTKGDSIALLTLNEGEWKFG